MSSRVGLDPRVYRSLSDFQWKVELNEGLLTVPRNMSPRELEWEFWVSKLHWNHARASQEDLETIKKIAEKL